MQYRIEHVRKRFKERFDINVDEKFILNYSDQINDGKWPLIHWTKSRKGIFEIEYGELPKAV